jgi:carboxypeptidase T
MAQQRVTLIGPDEAAMADLVRVHGVGIVRQTLRELPDGRWRVQAFGEAGDLSALAAEGFDVDTVEEAEVAPPPTRESRTAAAGGAVDLGAGPAPGGPAGYLDVVSVDRWTIAAAGPPNETVTELMTLPYPTWEGRRCLALRIGAGGDDGPGICVLAGVHAREWGSPDIVVGFAERLLAAYRAGRGIAIGRRRYPAAQIARLVETANVYLLPQVNPDGRAHSFTVDPMWRKNRRPAPAGSTGGAMCVGVDVNRNFDFLWDFETHFDPEAPIASSAQPCHPDVYVGPQAASEPETRNVVWLLDRCPDIEFLVDLHSYGELIMYSWGDDENQSRRRGQAFTNPQFDGHRGRPGDHYGEYIPTADRKLMMRLARKMQAGIAASRGRTYRVQQSMNLYPTTGTADDYAYSRHLVDGTRTKVIALTVEWGAEDNPTPFHPPYDEMSRIIAEVTSGLLAFCADALRISSTRRRQEAN